MKKMRIFLVILFLASLLGACDSVSNHVADAPDATNAATESKATSFIDDPEAMNTASESVLTVEIYDEEGSMLAHGSGFFIYDDATIATNYHVIEGAYSIKVLDGNGRVSKVKSILAYDADYDIALLSISSGKGYKPLAVNEERMTKGEKVVAIGSPLGITNTFSTGIVSGYVDLDSIEYMQFTAPISGGSSGGALFDNNGKVIGVTSATYVEGQNMNLAIPIFRILELYEDRPSEPISPEDLYESLYGSNVPEDYTIGILAAATEEAGDAEYMLSLVEQASTKAEVVQIMDTYGADLGGSTYIEVTQDTLADAYVPWCFDPKRSVGDCKIFHDREEYVVMYFCGAVTEEPIPEPTKPAEPEYIAHDYMQYDEEENAFCFTFELLDIDENSMIVDATVDMIIENAEGVCVYSGTHRVTAADYSEWYNSSEEWVGAAVYVPVSDISKGTTPWGTLYYLVTVGDVYFEYDVQIDGNLPLESDMGDFETMTFSGNGPGYVKDITLPYGTYNIILTHNGSGNFIVYLNEELIANEIGKTSFIHQVKPGDNKYYTVGTPLKNGYLNITMADGDWTITIEKVG